MTTSAPELPLIVDAIRRFERFVISSHSRPDGDAIGSQLAMAYALRALGKEVAIVNADPAPGPLMAFPGVPDIVIAPEVERDTDAGKDTRGRTERLIKLGNHGKAMGPAEGVTIFPLSGLITQRDLG